MEEMDEEVSEEDMDEVVYEIEMSEEDHMEGEEEVAEYKEEATEEYGGNKGDIPSDDRKKDGHYGSGPKEKETADEEGEEDYQEKGEATEIARSNAGMRKVPNAKSAPETAKRYASDRMRPAERVNESEKELQQLREKNEEYRKALNIFKEKLNEVAVFNSNLAYATRLFTENTTTKQEKINILRRFDSVETLKESKNLYKTLKEEFESKEANTISESVSEKVSKSPSKGSSANLIESKTYENPQFMRMKDLMTKIIK
jgi:hypothetical protein